MKHEQGNFIFSMGAMYLDFNARDPSYRGVVRPNGEVVHGSYEISLGGSALVFARAAVAQGMRVHFLGKAGMDQMGDIIMGKLTDEGIIPTIVRSHSVQTNINANVMGADGETYYQSFGSANQSLSVNDIKTRFQEVAGEINFLYLGGCYKLSTLLPAFPDIIAQAKKAGIKVIIDHGRVPQENDEEKRELRRQQKKAIRELIGMSDVYLPSMDEFLETWEVENLAEGLTRVKQIAPIIVVKNGEKGAVGFAREGDEINVISIPSFPVVVTNTIGAGDVFDAAFIRAVSCGLSFENSIRYANAAAALKISTNGFPSENDVRTLLSSLSTSDVE